MTKSNENSNAVTFMAIVVFIIVAMFNTAAYASFGENDMRNTAGTDEAVMMDTAGTYDDTTIGYGIDTDEAQNTDTAGDGLY